MCYDLKERERESEREVLALVNDKNKTKQTKRKRRALRGDKFGLERDRETFVVDRASKRDKKKEKIKTTRARARYAHLLPTRITLLSMDAI